MVRPVIAAAPQTWWLSLPRDKEAIDHGGLRTPHFALGRQQILSSYRVRRRLAVSLGAGSLSASAEPSLPQQCQSPPTYVLNGETILAHDDIAWCRRTKAVYAEDVSAFANVAVPSLRCAGFHGKAGAG